MKDKVYKAAISQWWGKYNYGHHERSMKIEELDNYLFIVVTCLVIIVISLYIIFKLLNKMKKNNKILKDKNSENNKIEK